MVKFVQPDAQAVQSAMKVTGSCAQVSPAAASLLSHYEPWFQRAATAGLFTPLEPKRGDWLREHEEKGQGVLSFLRRPLRAQPHATFQTVVIVPIGEHDMLLKVLPPLQEFIAAYYCLNVEVATPATFAEVAKHVTVRDHPDYGRQLHAGQVIDFANARVKADRALSRKCCGVVALTMEDLYPRDSWNFVFGLARGAESAAVVSLVRYLEDSTCSALQRTCKVVTHELGHVFGLGHCIYFGCLMNGSNHLEELDRNPLQLCPVCLKKMMIPFQWNLLHRARGIATVCQELDLSEKESAFAVNLVTEFEAYERSVGPPPGPHVDVAEGRKSVSERVPRGTTSTRRMTSRRTTSRATRKA